MEVRILLFLIYISSALFAQKKDNYLEYYQLCNAANRCYNHDDYKSALDKYDSAFRLVHYQHVHNLLNAAVAALKAEDKKSAHKYLRTALLHGCDPKRLSHKNFAVLIDNPDFKGLRDSADIFHKKFLARINKKYAQETDSLFYVDQVVIRNVKTLKPLYKTDVYVYASERPKYDSINFQHLLKLVERFGFPSEEKIGPTSYEAIKLVIHHSARMPANSGKMPIFESALSNGDYLPQDFAWMFDQWRVNNGGKRLFYFRVGNSSTLTEKEKRSVDTKRAEYGLWPLADDDLKRAY